MSDTTIDQLLPGRAVSSGFTAPPRRQPQAAQVSARRRVPHARRVTLRVAWGDLARISADLHVVGHYRGVMPTAAERALDLAISPVGGREVIAEHTRRRRLGGALGEVTYFPGRVQVPGPDTAVLRAAVAGMGRAGAFTQDNAVRLYESLLREVIELGYIRTLATVPIGAGAGNLSIRQVARTMVTGYREALRTSTADELALREVVVIEVDRLRAEQCHRALADAAEGDALVTVSPQLTGSPGGTVGDDAAAVHAIRALLDRLAAGGEGARAAVDPAEAILGGVAEELRGAVRQRLTDLSARSGDVTAVTIEAAAAPAGRAGRRAAAPLEGSTPATRVTVLRRASGLVWSALSARATVPEREVALNSSLVTDLVARLTAPSEDDARDLPLVLTRFLVPRDLQHYLTGDAPLILEVDPYTATVPWEFLVARSFDVDGGEEPLAIRQCLARQMRTSYARTDVDEPSVDGMKALVVGDPGDPARNQSLPRARVEAAAVAAALTRHKINVDLLVGAPGTLPTSGAPFATRLDVLARMLTGKYDIVHYSGHGVFDPAHPELSGWLFADGLLAARELAQFARAPRLVMANACWSAARPELAAPAEPERGRQGELAPVLADEFLRVGAGHFIGATWRVPDGAAEDFATSFYDALLGTRRQPPATVGEALRHSRQRLWEAGRGATGQLPERLSAWAAYQHYGDPGDFVVPTTAAGRPR